MKCTINCRMLLVFLLAGLPFSMITSQDQRDPHTNSNYWEVSHDSIHWEIDQVDFAHQQLHAKATYFLNKKEAGVKSVKLDAQFLCINSVEVASEHGDFETSEFKILPSHHVLGDGIEIPLKESTSKVKISYSTTPQSTALAWVPESHTDSGLPMVFTGLEPINCRTMIPIMDTPNAWFTFSANVKVPDGMIPLMSGYNPKTRNADNIYDIRMDMKIPSYLFALAIGHFDFHKTGERTGIFSEPSLLPQAAKQLSDLEKILKISESIIGSYEWKEYNILFLPSCAYPAGAMENPLLTHASSMLLTEDNSLVHIVFHEIFHSWSGNTSCLSHWEDIWITEGLTEYLAWRGTEVYQGKDDTDVIKEYYQKALEVQMDKSVDSPWAELKLDVPHNVHPNRIFSIFPYVKGASFFMMCEHVLGRSRFDGILKQYFQNHINSNLTTERFLAYLTQFMSSEEVKKINIDEWVYSSAKPSNFFDIKIDAKKLDEVHKTMEIWTRNKRVDIKDAQSWNSYEWSSFFQMIENHKEHSWIIESLVKNHKPDMLTLNEIAKGDLFQRVLEFQLVDDLNLKQEISHFLRVNGRVRLIKPIYKLITDTDRAWAKEVFEQAYSCYHPITKNAIKF